MRSRLQQAASAEEWMVGHRRELHRHPEVGIELPRTHEYLGAVLTDLGLAVEHHEAAGLTVRIPGHSPDGTVSILRADMDALPVHERTELDFASLAPGAMHACGHDLHMAMLLGAAKMLAENPPRRDTVLVFQPGEESDRGALATLSPDPPLILLLGGGGLLLAASAGDLEGGVGHRPVRRLLRGPGRRDGVGCSAAPGDGVDPLHGPGDRFGPGPGGG